MAMDHVGREPVTLARLGARSGTVPVTSQPHFRMLRKTKGRIANGNLPGEVAAGGNEGV